MWWRAQQSVKRSCGNVARGPSWFSKVQGTPFSWVLSGPPSLSRFYPQEICEMWTLWFPWHVWFENILVRSLPEVRQGGSLGWDMWPVTICHIFVSTQSSSYSLMWIIFIYCPFFVIASGWDLDYEVCIKKRISVIGQSNLESEMTLLDCYINVSNVVNYIFYTIYCLYGSMLEITKS